MFSCCPGLWPVGASRYVAQSGTYQPAFSCPLPYTTPVTSSFKEVLHVLHPGEPLCPMEAFDARRSPDATGQASSQSPRTPAANAPLALTPVHTSYPEEGSGSVHPPSARLQPAKSVSRRGPPAKSATFPNASSSSFKPGASSAVQRSKAQHVSDEHNSGISFWEGQHGSTPGRLGCVEESMQPGTPTSGCTSDAVWEQHGNSPWSLRLPHCKPLRIAHQHSGSDASTSKTFEDVSTPCSPKASPKILVVCRICEEQASTACGALHKKPSCLASM